MKTAEHLLWLASLCLSLSGNAFESCPQRVDALLHADLRPHWSEPDRLLTSPLAPEVVQKLDERGVVVVTAGGSSLSAYFPEAQTSAKIHYARSPESVPALVSMIADVAAPSLKDMAARGRFHEDHPPIVLLPAPGLAKGNSTLVLPGNFGSLGGSEVELSKLLRAELLRRSDQMGIPRSILSKTTVHVENDALPVVANAAYNHLKEGERASVLFVGTGTGSAKVMMKGPRAFDMTSAEESHLLLKAFPGASEKIPDAIRWGSLMANTDKHVSDVSELTLENVSAGGRVTNAGNRSHLGGADSVALSYVLDPQERPQWVVERARGDESEMRTRVLKSLGLQSPAEAKALIARSPADQHFVNLLKEHGSVSLKDVGQSAQEGSLLAQRLVEANAYTQGLVGGLISLNVGPTPAGIEIPAKLIYGSLDAAHPQVKMLVRTSEGLSAWATQLASAQAGANDAKALLFSNPLYVERLKQQGYALDPAKLRVSIERVYPRPDLHPDFAGLDGFADQLRNQSRP